MMLNRVFAVQVLEEVVDVVGMSNLFFEAAETELRLPAVRRQSVKSCWPDYAPDVDLAFGYNETITRLAKARIGSCCGLLLIRLREDNVEQDGVC